MCITRTGIGRPCEHSTKSLALSKLSSASTADYRLRPHTVFTRVNGFSAALRRQFIDKDRTMQYVASSSWEMCNFTKATYIDGKVSVVIQTFTQPASSQFLFESTFINQPTQYRGSFQLILQKSLLTANNHFRPQHTPVKVNSHLLDATIKSQRKARAHRMSVSMQETFCSMIDLVSFSM